MKYYIIAGEASGDLHGSNLIKALRVEDSSADIRIWGGDLMQQAGGDLVKHYKDLAFMGFVEVVKNLKTILGNIRFCKEDIQAFDPDVLIFIDYPGFNLRIAKWAKQQGYKCFYYISPQIWAWHTSRVHQIKKNVDRMFVILPFERAFYQKYDYEVDYVGHPLLDVVRTYRMEERFFTQNKLSNKPIIALLPGSRKQEIAKMLKGMLSIMKDFDDYQFVIAGAPSMPLEFYEEILQLNNDELPYRPPVLHNQTYDLLQHAKAALVTSGTATLETALFNVPQVVCYKGSPISYFIAKRLVDLKYISLVNLIVDRPVIKELIQDDFNTHNLRQELAKLLHPSTVYPIFQGYKKLNATIGDAGASRRTAELMVSYLREA